MPIQLLAVNAFLKLAHSRNIPVLDVRAPLEFAHGHLPGALSFPLFTDEERKQIGTTYKQVSKDQAVLLGLDFFGPKMAALVRQANILAPAKEVLLHCWRGGMRSSSVAWLLDLAGFRVYLLQEGYKAYRRRVQQVFDYSYPFVVVGGLTGSGKTSVLHELRRLGEQVIDLEGLAHHKGSAFGGIGQAPQPSVEQFENNLAQQLLSLDTSRRIWLEDENITIGRVNIPPSLYHQMQQAPLLQLEIPKTARIQKLTAEYQSVEKIYLQQAIDRIKTRLGGLAYQEATQAIAAGEIEKMVALALVYYDKAYAYQLANKPPDKIIPVNLAGTNAGDNAREILEVVREKGL